MKKPRIARWLAASLTFGLLTVAHTASAWNQPGHMVSAIIAYDELAARDPKIITRVMEMIASQPDRGAFIVAAGDERGDGKARRTFMEMARWPDDIRGGMYDHPTWHYADRPLIDTKHPPSSRPAPDFNGQALEALALNAAVIADARAPVADRAVALCWLFHLVGDMQQPLHAASEFSAKYSRGDHGGGAQYVIDPLSKQPSSLHWYWDQAVHRDPRADAVNARARELEASYPRKDLSVKLEGKSRSARFLAWADEGFALAKTDAYTPDLYTAERETEAPPLTQAYIARSTKIAEQRLALAGYRLADLLIELLGDAPK